MHSPLQILSQSVSLTMFENISVRTGLIVRGAFENVGLKVCFMNGHTYLLACLLTYLLSQVHLLEFDPCFSAVTGGGSVCECGSPA